MTCNCKKFLEKPRSLHKRTSQYNPHKKLAPTPTLLTATAATMRSVRRKMLITVHNLLAAVQHTPETDDNGNTATSRCFWIRDLLKNINTTTGMNLKKKEDPPEEGSTMRINDDIERMRSQRKKLRKKLTSIEQQVKELAEFHTNAGRKDLDRRIQSLQNLVENEDFEKQEASTSKKTPAVRLAEIKKEIMNLMKHLSSPETASKEISLSAHLQSSTGSNGHSAVPVHKLVNLHQDASFMEGSFYKEIKEIFDGLDEERKFLLSCFTVFPENAVVKRRIFVYWGVGEGWWNASGSEDEMPEKIVDGILEEFQEKGLIESAIKKRTLHVKSYKMHPLVRSAVTMLSQEAGNMFDYDDKGNVLPQKYWTSELLGPREEPVVKVNVSFPRCKRMCLLKVEEEDQELKLKLMQQLLEKNPFIPKESQSTSSSNSEGRDLEKIVTLFNVNEPFPDLELAGLMKKKGTNGKQIKVPSAKDWLSKMKRAKVVCLGSWPGSVKRHIEVESIEFLEGLKNSPDLRFLSLQRVSSITKIPEFIGNHSNLLILDLKECHNLVVLSKEIGKLTNLRYLDLSDCYLLARLPKELSALVQLQVLKGFVISKPQKKGSATLDDLKELKKLRKLTINANFNDFPTDEDLRALQLLGKRVLRKLTIEWGVTLADQAREAQNGGDASCWKIFKSAPKQHNPKTVTEKLPEQLEKLELQCFPNSTATWLTPDSLPLLEKLYIRGGYLATLDRSKWLKVRALRLKYLRELKMNWRELNDSFPHLEYLEKVKCPGITLCPCDEHGVWMKNPD